MTDSVSTVLQEVLGIGHVMDDANPTPTPFRPVPIPVAGTQPTVPLGAPPTESQAGKIPQPV